MSAEEIYKDDNSEGLILFGRFMLPDKREYPCRVLEISPGSAVLKCEHQVNTGVHIIIYIDEIGRVEGDITEANQDSFSVHFTVTQSKQEKISAKLQWLYKRSEGSVEDYRAHARYEPVGDGKSQLILPDGRSYSCKIIDMSITGAAIEVDVLPSVGTQVTLGKMRGRVTRIHDSGIAIEFMPSIDYNTLSDHIED